MIISTGDAAERLSRGEVVAYPTETVYGLGVDTDSATALAALNQLKGRDAEQGMSVLVPDLAALEARRVPLPEVVCRLAARYWPGPLTLVLPLPEGHYSLIRTAYGVGFRCSPDPTASALARLLPARLVSTSANRSGEPPCTDAEQVESVFGRDFPIAGGDPAGAAEPSTVVAVRCSGALECLRSGAIPFAELEKEL